MIPTRTSADHSKAEELSPDINAYHDDIVNHPRKLPGNCLTDQDPFAPTGIAS